MTWKMDAYLKASKNDRDVPAKRMNLKKVLLVAVVVNLIFLGAYFSMSSISASAAEDKTTQAAVRKEPVQDMRAQLDSLKQREEVLRVRQRELQLLESRIDEKIRRLSQIETNVKAEIAMYKGISDERTKHLVKIYSSMKPKAASILMNQMDIEVATEVFLSMKGEIAGGILANMEPVKAAAISKRLMSSRKLSSSAPQAGPQSAAPQGVPGETPATALTAPGTATQVATAPAPRAKARTKSLAKAKPWTPPVQTAAQEVSQITVPQAAPQATAAKALPQAEAKPSAAPAAAQAAPQASASPASPKASLQVLAQTAAGQAEQK